MKLKFSILIFFYFVSKALFSQNLPKEIMGSFALNNNVYNYVYNQHSKSYQHSFKILKLENYDLTFEIDSMVKQTAELKKITVFKNELDSLDNQLTNSLKNLNDLRQYSSKIQSIIEEILKIDSIEIKRLYEIIKKNSPNNLNKEFYDTLKYDKSKLSKNIILSLDGIKNAPNDNKLKSLLNELDYLKVKKSIQEISKYLILLKELNSKISGNNFNSNSINNYFSQFDIETFEAIFLNELIRNNIIEKNYKDSTNELKKLAYNTFYSIKTRLNFLDDEPITAYLYLKNKSVTCEIHDNKKIIFKSLPIQEVTIEFDNGTMKNIFVDLLSENGDIKRFRNNLPITISGKFSTDILRHIELYSTWSANKSDYAFVVLYDVIFYKILPSVNNEDYSPASTIIKLTTAAGENFAELKKEKRSKILEFKTFSDFVGIDNDQPNGLIQIELAKRLNINSRHGFGLWPINFLEKWKIIKSNNSIRNYSNHVFFPTIEFKGRISKIEENNDTLLIKDILLDKISYLRLNQHQTASFGLDLTYLRWNITELALDFQGNFGSNWMRTKIVDNNNIMYPINSVVYKFGWQVGFHPDSRIGFHITYNWQKINGLNKVFDLNKNSDWNKNNNTIKSYIFDVFFKTNEENKIFGRYAFNFLHKNINSENFVQVQIGYSTNIFANKK